ncbi:MAG: cytochrome c biogenesis protein CcsA [Melioribacteraceae bacterium]|nr:cytochrome c biogenesis protein CcsA [Melioribacteraceae bacterium]
MIGNIILTLGLLTAVVGVVMYYLTFKGYNNTLSIARLSFHATVILIIAASAFLLHAILTHQYQYKYVYNYSGSDLQIGLLISTFWAGQEGSFMLWTLFTAIVGLILLDYTSKRGDLEPRVMVIFSLVLSFLLIMLNPLLKSPFNYIWMDQDFINLKSINPAFLSMPALQSFMFNDPQSGSSFIQMGKELYATLTANNIAVNDFIIEGKGLNPLLQNFWMQIHPPILFVGFAMSAVPFSFAFAAILKNEYKDWVKQSLPWVLAGTMVLGAAIMLGGYWAYGVLGWGGYWGWDPVENSSLVPWIIGVASIHTLLVQKKTQDKGGSGRFVKTNLILSILTYILVLYSTFLTRSGILGDASVHSFVDPGMTVYLFLVIFLGLFTLLGIGGIAYRWKYLTENFSFEENVLSRELALFTGAVALIASAIIVFVGTSAPIFGQTVEIKFYNELNLPIAIIIGFLNGFSILLKWKHTEGKDLWKQSRFAILSALILTASFVIIGGLNDVMLIILAYSSSFALFVNGEIAYKIFKGKKSFLGAYVAHIGIAIFFIGVLATGGHSEHKQVDLTKGEKVNVYGHELSFLGYEPFDNGKRYYFNVEVKKGSSVNVIKPVMFVAEFNNSLMREPDILVGLTKDFYIAPVSYSDGTEEGDHNHSVIMKKGETFDYNGTKILFNSFVMPENMESMMSGGGFKIGIDLKVTSNGKTESLQPVMQNTGEGPTYIPAESKSANLRVSIITMTANEGKVELEFSNLDGTESKSHTAQLKEVLTIEASIKPFISLVWIGVIVMALGFIIAAFRRSKESYA